MSSSTHRPRATRFNIALAVELTQAGPHRVCDRLTTRNVSSSGVLLSAPSVPVEVGQELEYFVTLPTQPSGAVVRLRCMGRVVRQAPDRSFAASIERFEFVSSLPVQ